MTDLDYDAVISFLNKVISWRADYKPEWKQAHIDKWNSYLSLLLPQHAITVRSKYNVPSDILPMRIPDLKKKSELNARWKESYDMWLFECSILASYFPMISRREKSNHHTVMIIFLQSQHILPLLPIKTICMSIQKLILKPALNY